MNVPVILYGSSILRKYSVLISRSDDHVEMAINLSDTLKEKGGIGLAAPQIGILKRIFVIDTTPLFEKDHSVDRYEKVFLNPEILERSNHTEIYEEGCLSIPGIYEEIERPGKISVRYMDTGLNVIEEEIDGIKARIFQHEYDHLHGILFIDKLNPLRRELLRGKLNRIKKYYKNHGKLIL